MLVLAGVFIGRAADNRASNVRVRPQLSELNDYWDVAYRLDDFAPHLTQKDVPSLLAHLRSPGIDRLAAHGLREVDFDTLIFWCMSQAFYLQKDERVAQLCADVDCWRSGLRRFDDAEGACTDAVDPKVAPER